MASMLPASELPLVRAIAFDIFGTVVDWRGTIVSSGKLISETVDWGKFAEAWTDGYRKRVESARMGHSSWAKLDVFLDSAFDDLVGSFDLTSTDPTKLDVLRTVWHRLRPWPDVIPGLLRLRKRFTLSAMSNGNIQLLTDMARYSGLPWDCVFSAESSKLFKPEPAVYRQAVEAFGSAGGQVIYVAAHEWDLRAGQQAGMLACYLPRPEEMGVSLDQGDGLPQSFDLYAESVEALADALLT